MAAINFKTLSTDEQFAAARKSINTRGNSVQLDVHLYLNAVAARFVETGDVRPVVARVNSLIDEAPKGFRLNAVRSWVEKFLGLAFDDNGVFVAGAAKAKNVDLKECANNRWWEFKPESKHVPISDFEKMIQSLIAKGKKDQKELGDKSVVTEAHIAALNLALVSAKAPANA